MSVGASKIWWSEGFLPEFLQTCPKRFSTNCKFSPTKIMKTFFGMTSKKVFMCFSGNTGCHFFKSNNVGRHFCPDCQEFCQDFQGFCPDFQGFCPDFWQIKTFGGTLAPPPPTLLATQHYKSVVLNWETRSHRGASRDFHGGASPYMLYNMESFWTEMCAFQTFRQCEFYAATCYLV